MQNYLHISKKSSIFAPDLGIVPTITLKKGKDMTNECVWKCQTGKVIVKVIKVNNDWRFKCTVYRVYIGRKWWCRMTYEQVEHALSAAIFVSLLGNYQVSITKVS